MIRHKTTAAVRTSCLLLLLVGCDVREVPTTVRIGEGPSFLLHGSGRLASFSVYAPLKGQKVAFPHTEISDIAWQIRTSGDYFDGSGVDGLELVYGRIPKGYKQTVPSGPQAAPPLQTGLIYSFFAESTGAGVTSGSFYVEKAGTILPVVTDLCLTSKNSRNSKVSCKTGEPYEEPADIGKFAREHQKSQWTFNATS